MYVLCIYVIIILIQMRSYIGIACHSMFYWVSIFQIKKTTISHPLWWLYNILFCGHTIVCLLICSFTDLQSTLGALSTLQCFPPKTGEDGLGDRPAVFSIPARILRETSLIAILKYCSLPSLSSSSFSFTLSSLLLTVVVQYFWPPDHAIGLFLLPVSLPGPQDAQAAGPPCGVVCCVPCA